MMVLLSTAYFAPIQYYSKLASAEKVILEKHENFQKQTYRNRCIIYSANGPLTLSVPVNRGEQLKIYTKDIRIDNSTNWQKIHSKAIESAYRCSPFYEYYIDDLIPFFQKKYSFLYDFNLEILYKTCKIISFKAHITETDDYISAISDGIQDFRELIHPKQRMYRPDPTFQPPVYNQVFQSKGGFIANLSIIDLIFNTGTEALHLIRESFIHQ